VWTAAAAALGLLVPALAVLATLCVLVLAAPAGGRAAFAPRDPATL